MNEARERILLGAAVADLRETVYRQQCLLEALLQSLEDDERVDSAAVRDLAAALAAQGPGQPAPLMPGRYPRRPRPAPGSGGARP